MYGYIVTKVRARIGNLLTREKFGSLVMADLREIKDSLRGTDYREVLETPEEPTANDLQRPFNDNLVRNYIELIKASEGKLELLLTELLRRFEVRNLRALLGAVEREVRTELEYVYPVEQFFRRKLSRLVDAEDPKELVEVLPFPYNSALKGVYPNYEEERNLSILTNALESHRCGQLWKKINDLPEIDRKVAKKALGMELDIKNIMTTLRCKLEDVTPAEIKKHLLPWGYEFESENFLVLEDVGSIADSMPPQPYGDVLSESLPSFEESGSLFVFEIALRRKLLENARKLLYQEPFRIGDILAFLRLKENEVESLSKIVVLIEEERRDEIEDFLLIP